jgi:hypothetical protein
VSPHGDTPQGRQNEHTTYGGGLGQANHQSPITKCNRHSRESRELSMR